MSDELCLKCNRLSGDIVHDTQGHQGTGCWVVHPFVGAAEKHILRWALREASMVMKAGQKGSRLTEAQAQWNVAIDAAKTRIERMWLPVTATGQPIQPELDQFDQYFKDEYAALPSAPELPTWQPMESALLDGTWILVRRSQGHPPLIVRRINGFWQMDGDYYRPDGGTFTHWAPLPLHLHTEAAPEPPHKEPTK